MLAQHHAKCVTIVLQCVAVAVCCSVLQVVELSQECTKREK